MDIKPQAQQSISDDQELAKVLAGINQHTEVATSVATDTDSAADESADVPLPEPPVAPPIPEEPVAPTALPTVAPVTSELDSIKQDALTELRPLVDKLDVSPEEKFDTSLLLLRSTDDQTLIGPAFAAARTITDEARRAQALLDIIKEIDYLSGAATQPTA